MVFQSCDNTTGKMLLFCEAAARVIKKNIMMHLRELCKELRIPMEVCIPSLSLPHFCLIPFSKAPYRGLVVKKLGKILKGGKETKAYWKKELMDSFNLYFNFEKDFFKVLLLILLIDGFS